MKKARVILLNKPWGVLSQFTDAEGRPTLADYVDIPAVYPAGRLDMDSEGLLVLTDSGSLQARLSGSGKRGRVPTAGHRRAAELKCYSVQVEGHPDAVATLAAGVELRDGPARFRQVRFDPPPPAWTREPRVDPKRHPVTRWVEVALDEGRNRQVRRMLAAMGYPVLRLVRTRVGPFRLGGLAPGEFEVRELFVP